MEHGGDLLMGTWKKAVVLGMLLGCLGAQSAAAADTRIEVLSNRADLISAGDALVAVDLPAGVDPARRRGHRRRRATSPTPSRRAPNGRFEGLRRPASTLGANVLTAHAARRLRAPRITITNHPNGGPVFSGPQVQPWVCQATAPRTRSATSPSTYEYQYKSTQRRSSPAYDPDEPARRRRHDDDRPGQDGALHRPDRDRLPGPRPVQDRGPLRPVQAVARRGARRTGWNHKLLITHGASCGIDHQAGSAPDVMNDAALSRGFAVMSTALNNAGHNCNLVTQAESMVMAKERLVEQYGELRYTIGTGCSGGSLTQQQVANAYPGIYQGILPACSFPDAWSTGPAARRLPPGAPLRREPGQVGAGRRLGRRPAIAAVEGHPEPRQLDRLRHGLLDVARRAGRRLPGRPGRAELQRRDQPRRRPLHARRLHDQRPRPAARASCGRRRSRRLGHGFAGLPLDNVGVQYGLEALEEGPDHAGAVRRPERQDRRRRHRHQPDRRSASPADAAGARATPTAAAAINSGNNLDQVAIIDLRGPDPGAFHDAYRSWAIRARLEREHGTFAQPRDLVRPRRR